MPLFQAVIFDMDGLLIDSERMAHRCWQIALAEYGYEINAEIYLRLVGRTLNDAIGILKDEYGSDFPFDPIYNRRQALYEQLIATEGIPVKPGTVELLEHLVQRGTPRAVASSTRQWFATLKLTATDLLKYFPVVVCGDDVPNGKPAPDIFLEAARRLDVPPSACLVLEDSDAGIQAAASAGMTAILIPDLKPPTPEITRLAWQVLPSLAQVIPLIQAIESPKT